jgi:acyl-CoA thioesterase-1
MIMFRRCAGILAALTITSCAPADEEVPRERADADVARTLAPQPPAGAAAAPRAAARTILFIGTSLTAGYGVGSDAAWPAVIQQKVDSAGLPFRVVNAGVSGETSAGGLRRIDWSLQQPVDVLVLELGANDGLRGLDPDAMRANLDGIVQRTRSRYPGADIILIGMEAPPNLGDAYTTRFRRVFVELARTHNAPLVPFFLDGVAGVPALNLADGIHPNVQGHRILAANVWPVLERVLRARTGG